MKQKQFLTMRATLRLRSRRIWKVCSMAMIACGVFFFGACADHYDGDETWSSPVRNATLQSPDEAEIKIEKSADGSQMTITWPVVYGAGGYEFQLFNANDETTPIVTKTIDGCQITVDREEDMNYKIVIRTLGNTDLNNTEASVGSVKMYSTFTESDAKIPAGDLYEYFQNNPIPEDKTGELNYDLEPGGQYTVSQPLSFNFHKIVLRTTDKTNYATITLVANANFIVSNDFTLKYVKVDASATEKPIMEAYKYEEEPEGILEKPGNYYLINFVRIMNCDIRGVVGSFFYDNNKPYAVVNFLIKNTIIEMTTTTDRIKNEAWISFQSGGVKDFSISNSTVFQTGSGNSKYFLRYNNSIRVDRLGYDKDIDHTTLTYTNNTFYKVASGNWSNYSGISNYSLYEVKNNIWHSCGDGAIARRIMGNGRLGNNSYATWIDNTYWNADGQIDQGNYDTGTVLTTDPAFVDPENGIFTPTGADQVAKQTGDPRWYYVIPLY